MYDNVSNLLSMVLGANGGITTDQLKNITKLATMFFIKA